ncbi:MAG: HD domain-containing protein [Desulfobacula sp.]|nr:HD domain-containing protein [Desulfobacula sp.]MDA8133963.1 HD domain-containing protein [Desulfobacteraceae bacterium]
MTTPNNEKRIPEPISLLYVKDERFIGEDKGFSKENGFALETCNDFEVASELAKLRHPDLILIESDNEDAPRDRLVKKLSEAEYKFKPAIFLSLAEYPSPGLRLKFFREGVDDILIRPFSTDEVKEKARIFIDKKNISQMNHALNQQLEKTTEYLKRFKQELKKTKTELYEERHSLNNALKQINQMANERTRLKRDIKIAKETLDGNVEGFSELLSGLIKIKIEKNRGHGERVAKISSFIAGQLKIDEKKLADLQKAAMLHETGLLFIPETTLQKEKEELTEFEKGLFLQYPVKGAEVLSSCTEFLNCAGIIRHLNENADGTGKPDGLKKRYIPLLSKILAGADVFDTLREEQDVSSLEKFLMRLEDYSGTRLDPTMVALLEKYAVLHMGSDDYCIKGRGIHQLEPGMTLGTALFTNTGTKLFSANTLLTQDAIDKIKKYSREYPVDETVYIRV